VIDGLGLSDLLDEERDDPESCIPRREGLVARFIETDDLVASNQDVGAFVPSQPSSQVGLEHGLLPVQ
jgi:hypothetical protein